MLEAVQLSRQVTARGEDPKSILDSVSFICPTGQVTLIVGTAGSGKRNLLEILASVRPQDQGVILLHGRDLGKEPLHPNAMGFVTASADALPAGLSVRETLVDALRLRVGGLTDSDIAKRVDYLLELCGLETAAQEAVTQLNPLQRRRLQLASTLVSDPVLVLCDDFTRGMDAKSERELLALLKMIASDVQGRVVLNVSASLSQLPAYDTVVVLHQGSVCFHGPARAIPHYFTIKSTDDLYPRLAMRPASRWADSWSRHRDSYYDAFKLHSFTAASGQTPASSRIRLPDATDGDDPPPPTADDASGSSTASEAPLPLPGAGLGAQVAQLTRKRWTLLRRNKHEWRTQLLHFFGLPALAVLMIWPNKSYLTAMLKGGTHTPEILWPAAYTCLMTVFIQVLLVVFMAARNSAREIARERTVIDGEHLAGVHPLAVLIAKVAFLGPLILGQSLWLGLCVEMFIGALPGPTAMRLLLLALTGAAFTALCLGISSRARSAERAHALCLLLAYAQVLLSGALLGMPRVLGSVLHPFVTAYYGWSGIIDGMKTSAVFAPVSTLLRTWFATPSLAVIVLLLHLAVGLTIAYAGLRKRRLP